jgi:DnaK suppressor protein
MNVEHYRRRLLAIERQLVARLGRSIDQAHESLEPGPIQPADLELNVEYTEEQLTEADVETATLAEVRDALRRIELGTYGRCLIDDEPIDERRLESIPWTPYCVRHQQEIEAEEMIRTPRV